jgi:TatD DNase family protein
MIFIDTHVHLYLEEFDNDRDNVVRNAIHKGVNCFFLPNIDSNSIDGMIALSDSFPDHCFPMMGLHPTSVKANYQEELAIAEKYLSSSGKNFYAIGEIGVDLYWDKTFSKEQYDAFSIQIDWAVKYDLPVVIHTRNSFEEAVEIVEKKNDPMIRGIFHCFGGSIKQAEKAIGLGFKLGIGGIITYKNSGLQHVVSEIALEHLVLETDAPFLSPVPYRGHRNESAYIPIIAQKIAEIKGISLEEVAKCTTVNALGVFQGVNRRISEQADEQTSG